MLMVNIMRNILENKNKKTSYISLMRGVYLPGYIVFLAINWTKSTCEGYRWSTHIYIYVAVAVSVRYLGYLPLQQRVAALCGHGNGWLDIRPSPAISGGPSPPSLVVQCAHLEK